MFLRSIGINIQLFNISLWDSVNRMSPDVGTLDTFDIHPIRTVLLLCLASCLLTIVTSGFSFYLWFYITSDDQSKCRLLNILNAYLAMACIGGSLTAFFSMVTIALGYEDQVVEHAIAGFMMTVVTGSFLLASVATFLNHFKPNLYLDISISWRHCVALPTILFSTILIRVLVNISCSSSEDDCDIKRLRKFILFPSSVITFLLKLIVIVDDFWGWKKIFQINQNAVIPMSVDQNLVWNLHIVKKIFKLLSSSSVQTSIQTVSHD